jgi:hypothetical protein
MPPASGRPVLDKYIYLELCFLLLGRLGYANIGYLLSNIYWVVRGLVASGLCTARTVGAMNQIVVSETSGLVFVFPRLIEGC